MYCSGRPAYAEIDEPPPRPNLKELTAQGKVVWEKEATGLKNMGRLERQGTKLILTYINWFRCSYHVGTVSLYQEKSKYILKMNMKRNWGWLNSCIEPREVKLEIQSSIPKGATLEIIGDNADNVTLVVP